MPLDVSSSMCPSSGGQNCIIQHLVLSHCVGGRPGTATYTVWKTPDDEQRNCPKHVEFYSKNKFK